MTLERIEDHVLGKAKAEASGIVDAARTEAGRITSREREEADAAFRAAVDRLKAQLAVAFERETGQLRTEERMDLLKRKSALLDDVFRKAAARVLADKRYASVVRRALKDLAGQKGKVLCRADQREATAKAMEELNAELKEKLPPLADEPADVSGGFVFQSDAFDVDYSLDSQIKAFRENLLPELIAKAFPEA